MFGHHRRTDKWEQMAGSKRPPRTDHERGRETDGKIVRLMRDGALQSVTAQEWEGQSGTWRICKAWYH